MNLSNYQENQLVDGLLRGGALAPAGTVNSTAVVKGIWTATTAYAVGDVVVPHAAMTAGGGKFLQCTAAGTSGSTTTLAVPAVGSTLTDSGVTWTAVSGIPSPLSLYVALFTINKGLRANSTAYVLQDVVSLTPAGGAGGDTRQHLYQCTTAGTSAGAQPGTYLGVPAEAITDGTAVFTEMSNVLDSNTGFPTGFAEVSGGSYARVPLAPTLANWAGTQSAGSTTSSTGTNGTTSNNSAITFAAPTANWAASPVMIGAMLALDQLSGGNLRFYAPLTVPKNVNSGDAAPSYAAAALSLQVDN